MPEIYAPPGVEPVWPASIETLEQFYQQTAFPSFMTTEEKEEFWLFSVDVLPQPEHNPRLEVCSQRPPELTDDHWVVAWDKRDATPEEIAAWDAAHPPEPDWTTFKLAIWQSPDSRALLTFLSQNSPENAASLVPALLNASNGTNESDFISIWSALKAAGAISPSLSSFVHGLSIDCHLPSRFQELFQP